MTPKIPPDQIAITKLSELLDRYAKHVRDEGDVDNEVRESLAPYGDDEHLSLCA